MRGLAWSMLGPREGHLDASRWEKREKLAACAWTATCTAFNAASAQPRRCRADVDLVYHGIDTRRFPPPTRP
jgi:hypothetical protein